LQAIAQQRECNGGDIAAAKQLSDENGVTQSREGLHKRCGRLNCCMCRCDGGSDTDLRRGCRDSRHSFARDLRGRHLRLASGFRFALNLWFLPRLCWLAMHRSHHAPHICRRALRPDNIIETPALGLEVICRISRS
jgi:hypothetical protein